MRQESSLGEKIFRKMLVTKRNWLPHMKFKKCSRLPRKKERKSKKEREREIKRSLIFIDIHAQKAGK